MHDANKKGLRLATPAGRLLGVATYLAFLRAINLGPRNKYPMPELRAALEAAGYADVRTYIQTGNVHLVSRRRSTAAVAAHVASVLAADRGFAVPTMVLTPAELAAVLDDAEQLAAERGEGWTPYVTLLAAAPEPARVEALARYAEGVAETARVEVRGRAAHLALREGYQSARIDNNRIERLLGVAGTSRTLGVVRRVVGDWCPPPGPRPGRRQSALTGP